MSSAERSDAQVAERCERQQDEVLDALRRFVEGGLYGRIELRIEGGLVVAIDENVRRRLTWEDTR